LGVFQIVNEEFMNESSYVNEFDIYDDLFT